LAIGRLDREEFKEAKSLLTRTARLHAVDGLRDAAEYLERAATPPELIILAPARPGQFPCSEVGRLRSLAPLARFWGLLGVLCEGEARSGKPWPGVPRCYWHQFAPRWNREIAAIQAEIDAIEQAAIAGIPALLPGSPTAWTLAILAAVGFPLYPLLLEAASGSRSQQPWRVFLRGVWEDGKTALAQVSLQVTFLASQAYERIHAIVLTLVRLGATQRRLLEWETAAASAARVAGFARQTSARQFLVEMIASPLIALVGLLLVVVVRPSALFAALPVLILWAAAPLVAYALSRPVLPRRAEPGEEDSQFLRLVARNTWRYFEAFMGPGDHALPPDNFQETPEPRIAHRTSPTNIGMGLLATLAAHDFGFIGTDELATRIDATLTTMEGLERFEGVPDQLGRLAACREACGKRVGIIDKRAGQLQVGPDFIVALFGSALAAQQAIPK
jgi:hypothetical protein